MIKLHVSSFFMNPKLVHERISIVNCMLIVKDISMYEYKRAWVERIAQMVRAAAYLAEVPG